jgi:antitoxin component of MazEF toxin-antitoxin module
MKKRTRLVDAKARMTLFRDFAGFQVTIERISSEEVRIRKLRARKRKYVLADLAARITPKNRHTEIATGSPVGGEIW